MLHFPPLARPVPAADCLGLRLRRRAFRPRPLARRGHRGPRPLHRPGRLRSSTAAVTPELMACAARAAHEYGSEIVAIAPRFFTERADWTEPLDQEIVVPDMAMRKRLMFEYADAFIALPGGIGTVEELAEVMTLAKLGRHAKPIVLANFGGFWTPWLDFLTHLAAAGFTDVSEGCAVVEDPRGHPRRAWTSAADRGRRGPDPEVPMNRTTAALLLAAPPAFPAAGGRPTGRYRRRRENPLSTQGAHDDRGTDKGGNVICNAISSMGRAQSISREAAGTRSRGLAHKSARQLPRNVNSLIPMTRAPDRSSRSSANLPIQPVLLLLARPKIPVVFEGCSRVAPHCTHANTAEIRSLKADILRTC